MDMSVIKQYLPLLIPLAIIELGLMAAALVHIFTHKTYKTGNRALWAVIAICFQTIGPVLYFILGRGEPNGGGDEGDE